MSASDQSYWHKWMSIPANALLYTPLPPRPVSFCILDAEPTSDHNSIVASFERLLNQKYQSWTAVYFAERKSE